MKADNAARRGWSVIHKDDERSTDLITGLPTAHIRPALLPELQVRLLLRLLLHLLHLLHLLPKTSLLGAEGARDGLLGHVDLVLMRVRLLLHLADKRGIERGNHGEEGS